MSSGEQKAWEMLREMNPEEVCLNSLASYDHSSGLYMLRSFSFDVILNPSDKTITSPSSGADILLKRLGYFFMQSAIWYMVSAKEMPQKGCLIKPVNLKGGGLFFRGSHVLPLENLAQRYGESKEEFIKKCESLSGKIMTYGDVSFELYPFPRIPITSILWTADEEFPPRADILFDTSIEAQLPLDIIWSISMLSILALL